MNNGHHDQTITCSDCNEDFTFSAAEQRFFAEKGFKNTPKRCAECRKSRRKQEGQHLNRLTYYRGTVKSFDCSLGMGFIQPDNWPKTERDVAVKYSAILSSDERRSLAQGQRVHFAIVNTPKGKQALNVTVLSHEQVEA